MSSAIAATPPVDKGLAFEQRIFVWSPLGTVPTAAILFLVLTASYVALAMSLHMPLFVRTPSGLRPESGTFEAAVLSLLVATVLGMQRYTALKDAADEAAFVAISTSAATAAAITNPVPPAQIRWATLCGFFVGIGLAIIVIPPGAIYAHPTLFAWHFVVTLFLGTLFGRGVLVTAQGGRSFAHLIEHDLKIDLLHIDKLSVIGQHCARNALVWLVCAAVVCLFFVGGGMSDATYGIIIVCAGLGLWIFFRPMEHVHRRIRAAKGAELDRVRDEIAKARDAAVHDASAATRLQGLLAYEARIQAVHEWPFDQSTMVRIAAYVLIPAIPWFGEAVVSDFVQRWAH